MIGLLVVLAVLCIVVWIISVLPIPASPLPIRNILYVIVGLAAIIYLLRFAGIA